MPTLAPLRAAYTEYSANPSQAGGLDTLSQTFLSGQENPTMQRAFLREVVADIAADYTVVTTSDRVRDHQPDKPVEAFCAFSRLTENGMNFKPNGYDVYFLLAQWNRSQMTSFDPGETGVLVKAVAEQWFEDGENSFTDALLSHMNPTTERGALSLFTLPHTTPEEQPHLGAIEFVIESGVARANADLLAYAVRTNIQDTDPQLQKQSSHQTSRVKTYLAPFKRSLTILPRWELREMLDALSVNGKLNRTEIAADLGVDPSLLSRVMTNSERVFKTTRMSDEDLVLRSLSTSRAGLASELGYTDETMRTAIKNARRSLRDRDIDASGVNTGELMSLVQANATPEEMAKRLGTDTVTIARALVDLGVQRRRAPEPKEAQESKPRTSNGKKSTHKEPDTPVEPHTIDIELEPPIPISETRTPSPNAPEKMTFDIGITSDEEMMKYLSKHMTEEEQILLELIASEATAYPLREACERVTTFHDYPRSLPNRLLRRVEGLINSMS